MNEAVGLLLASSPRIKIHDEWRFGIISAVVGCNPVYLVIRLCPTS